MRRLAALLLAATLLAAALPRPAEALPSQALVAKRARKGVAKRGHGRAGPDARLLAERPNYVAAATQRYLSNEELGAWLKEFEQRCKPIAKVHQIGTSGQGRCAPARGAAQTGQLLPPPPPPSPPLPPPATACSCRCSSAAQPAC